VHANRSQGLNGPRGPYRPWPAAAVCPRRVGKAQRPRRSSEGLRRTCRATNSYSRIGARPLRGSLFRHRSKAVLIAKGNEPRTIYSMRWFAEVGGLMSYGTSFLALSQQGGNYGNQYAKPRRTPSPPPARGQIQRIGVPYLPVPMRSRDNHARLALSTLRGMYPFAVVRPTTAIH